MPRLAATGHRDATAEALSREAHPLTGVGERLRPAAGTDRRRPLRPARRGLARDARVLPRARRITRRLIEEKGFNAVAVEADWPDAYRVNRYVRGAREDARRRGGAARLPALSRPGCGATPRCSTSSAGCAPTTNAAIRATRAGFYGLDLYSLHASIEAVIAYLETIDPPAAGRARERYACFEHFGGESHDVRPRRQPGDQRVLPTRGGRAARRAAAQLGRLPAPRRPGGRGRAVLRRAERAPGRPTPRSTTGRCSPPTSPRGTCATRHMADTLDRLLAHLERHGERAKLVVWEHNSHVGDARRTEMGERGELNVGQLTRSAPPRRTPRWSASPPTTAPSRPPRTGTPPPSASGSARPCRRATRHCSTTSDEPSLPARRLSGRRGRGSARTTPRARDRRHLPARDRAAEPLLRSPESHDQFDAVIHIDHTRAVEPLERTAGWELGEPPGDLSLGTLRPASRLAARWLAN